MEALRLTAKAEDGKLTVSVPEAFNNHDLEIIVLLQSDTAQQKKEEGIAELHRRRMAHFGKAEFPDFPTTKYDAYNQ